MTTTKPAIVPVYTALWPAPVTGALRRHVARIIRRDIRRGLVVAQVPSRCSVLVSRPGSIPAGVTLAEVVPMVGAPGQLAVRYLAA